VSASRTKKPIPLFVSGGGYEWHGVGRRPDWLRAELDHGEVLSAYLNESHPKYDSMLKKLLKKEKKS
jgi:DNA-binding protein H-NS